MPGEKRNARLFLQVQTGSISGASGVAAVIGMEYGVLLNASGQS